MNTVSVWDCDSASIYHRVAALIRPTVRQHTSICHSIREPIARRWRSLELNAPLAAHPCPANSARKDIKIMYAERFGSLWSSAAAVVFAGCATLQVRTDYDQRASFTPLSTYEWVDQEVDSGRNPAMNSPLLGRHIRDAVDDELGRMGYRKDESGTPDFRIASQRSGQGFLTPTVMQGVTAVRRTIPATMVFGFMVADTLDRTTAIRVPDMLAGVTCANTCVELWFST